MWVFMEHLSSSSMLIGAGCAWLAFSALYHMSLQWRLKRLKRREATLLEQLETSRVQNDRQLAATFSQPFIDAFVSRDTSFRCDGLCGRFIRGVDEHQLSLLSDEPYKELSWVCDDELLQSVLGKGPVAAMVQVGFGLDWIRARLDDGTTQRLVVFPETAEMRKTLATWDNLFGLVRECYSPTVAGILAPHMDALKRTSYT